MKKKVLVVMVVILAIAFLAQLATIMNSTNANAAMDKKSGKVECCYIECYYGIYPEPPTCWRTCIYVPEDECGALKTMH